MVFVQNVILSNVLDIKKAFLDYENIVLILIIYIYIGHLKKLHIDHSHKESISMWFFY